MPGRPGNATMGANLDNELILAHLARLDQLIRREVVRLRLLESGRGDDEFRGLYVSAEEVDALLDRGLSVEAPLTPVPPTDGGLAHFDKAIAAAGARVADLETKARSVGTEPRLDRLARLFGLSIPERDVLVIGLAAEVDLKYERLFAFLQDDVTKKRPTVELITRLLCPTLGERLDARKWFTPEAPLSRWNVATLHDDPGARRPVLLARYLKLDERVAGHLLGSEEIDSRLVPLASAATPAGSASTPPEARRVLEGWARGWPARAWDKEPVLLIHGRYGTGRRAAVRFLAQALGRPVLFLSAAELEASEVGVEFAVSLAERKALLTGALVCWTDADALTAISHATDDKAVRAFTRALSRGWAATVLLSEAAWEPGRRLGDRPLLRLGFPDPSYPERLAHWSTALEASGVLLSGDGVRAMSARFRLTPGQLQDAVEQARTLAWSRDPSGGSPTAADLDAACRARRNTAWRPWPASSRRATAGTTSSYPARGSRRSG